jgi:SAM-dependent methyltransferase
MTYCIPGRMTLGKLLGYLFWRWILRQKGGRVSELDAFFFGTSRGMNDYDELAKSYKRSNAKPDKLYSILPTVLGIVGDCTGKTAIDIGCGSGFFTLALARQGAAVVCGVDNSASQIRLAKEVSPHPSIEYVVGDTFVQRGGPTGIITAPFVVNYARTTPILQHFFELTYASLKNGGKAVFVIDLPNGKSLKRFGAMKSLLGPPVDETWIQIDLFNEEQKICELTAVYYTPATIERLLKNSGFKNIRWHKPVVSPEGISALGAEFWNGYLDDPELGYLSAEK